MKVLKFGGSSLGSVENLQRVLEIVKQQEDSILVVVSAFSGVTNHLQNLANDALVNSYQSTLNFLEERHLEMMHNLIAQPSNALKNAIETQMDELKQLCQGINALQELTNKTKAKIMAKGELLSSLIIAEFFNENQINIEHFDSRKLINATGNHLSATVDFETTIANCQSKLDTMKSYILPGFIACNEKGESVLLGRGGSDYSASIFGLALNATEIELWSDVNGMQNANPKLVKEAQPISEMSYEEAFEIAYFGAKVLYPPAIRPAMKGNIPVWLKNTLNPNDSGTIIHQTNQNKSERLLGVSTLSNISLVNISGVGLAGVKGSARRVFQALEQANINVILISQSCSEQSICFGIQSNVAQQAVNALEQEFLQEIQLGNIDLIDVENEQVILALVGDQMKQQAGLSGQVFSTLGENNINVRAIAQGSSERNISIVVHQNDEKKALNVLHEKFFQTVTKKVHLFVFGRGNVGTEFLSILEQQKDYCKANFNVEFRVVLLANSRKYCFSSQGLSQQEISDFEKYGQDYKSLDELVGKIQSANLRNSVVIDNTASAQISSIYEQFLKQSISIATCNKIACSSSFEQYFSLKQMAQKHNCSFFYETTVGASLPIIKTIQNLKLGGDSIQKIQAVVSGSLNFIFNQYDGTKPFVEIVQQAMSEGYTEPDPRIDLSGLDVKRKLLILAREAGQKVEMNDVKFESFLPKETEQANDVDDFLQILRSKEAFFQHMFANAQQNQAKLKVIAEMNGNQLRVALEQVNANSPFYQLDGKDNIVAFTTNDYLQEPLVVKGAGAGARITASGVFSDLMHLVNLER